MHLLPIREHTTLSGSRKAHHIRAIEHRPDIFCQIKTSTQTGVMRTDDGFVVKMLENDCMAKNKLASRTIQNNRIVHSDSRQETIRHVCSVGSDGQGSLSTLSHQKQAEKNTICYYMLQGLYARQSLLCRGPLY